RYRRRAAGPAAAGRRPPARPARAGWRSARAPPTHSQARSASAMPSATPPRTAVPARRPSRPPAPGSMPARGPAFESGISSTSPSEFVVAGSDRVVAGLAGADPDRLFDVEDEDLPVADLSGARRGLDRLDGPLDELVGHGGLDLHFRQEIDDVFGAAVQLGVALLAAEALDLGDRDALDADRGQRFADLVELERLDDRGDQFHQLPPCTAGRAGRADRVQNVLPTHSTSTDLPTSRSRALR